MLKVKDSSRNGTGVRSQRAAKAGKEFKELVKDHEEVLQHGSQLLVPWMWKEKAKQSDARAAPWHTSFIDHHPTLSLSLYCVYKYMICTLIYTYYCIYTIYIYTLYTH